MLSPCSFRNFCSSLCFWKEAHHRPHYIIDDNGNEITQYCSRIPGSRPLSVGDYNRSLIYDENLKIEKEGFYYFNQKKIYILDKLNDCLENTETIKPKGNYLNVFGENKKQKSFQRRISVTNESTFGAAIRLSEEYGTDKIVCLNFASSFQPGGGYINGRTAQEECLCRQSLLYPSLIKDQRMYDFNKKNHLKEIGSDLMIYSPSVQIIRNDNNELLKKPYLVNVITSPAVDQSRKSHSNSYSIMETRIRNIIKLSIIKGNRVAVFGAFGCGVYKNKPSKIASIFKKILVDEKLINHFHEVIFAIYGPKNQNFNDFDDVFSDYSS